MSDTLDSAIANAIATGGDSPLNQPIDGEPPAALPVKETPKEIPKETKVEGETEEEVKLSDTELIEAKKLYAGLKNKDTQATIAGWIAESFGYSKAEAKAVVTDIKETVKEVIKEQPKDVALTLKAKLGPEFDYLAEKLAPALEEIIADRLSEVTKGTLEVKQERELEKYERELTSTIDDLGQKFYKGDIPQDVQLEMSHVMDKFKDTGTMTPSEYIENVYHIAVGKMGKSPVVQKAITQKEVVKKPSDTLPNQSSQPLPNTNGGKPKAAGLDAAIRFSMEQLEQNGIKFTTN